MLLFEASVGSSIQLCMMIQKFSEELKSCYACMISKNNKTVLVPWTLLEVQGDSTNAEKLPAKIIHIISQVKPVKDGAYEVVPKIL